MDNVQGSLWDGPVVDAHQHFWHPTENYYPWLSGDLLVPHRYGDYTPVKRPYLPPDYLKDVAGHRVVQSVYVEAEWDPDDPIGETRYVTSLAERFGYPNAMVAQAWLDREDVEDTLAKQASFALVRSVRHKPGGANSPEEVAQGKRSLMSDERWRRGYALLSRYKLHFDLQAPWWNLGEAAELARDFPETLLIVNHTGVPGDRSPETLAGWRDAMSNLAKQRNVAVKISGLCQPDQPWTTEASAGVIQDVIRLFGTERVMFGSNFPVDGLFATFDQVFTTFKEVTRQYSEAEKRGMFCDNAARIYRTISLGKSATMSA